MSISKLTQNDKFRSWLNKVNEVIDVLNQATSDILNKAATKHNSTATTYGLGTSTEYGHVKLSDSVTTSSNTTKGIAATPSSVKKAYDLALEAKTLAELSSTNGESLSEEVAEIKTSLSNKAPTPHNSPQSLYGLGSFTDYGHVKLSSSIESEAGTESGFAATPLAVKTVNDKIDGLSLSVNGLSPIYHASENEIYGIGTNSLFGHLKISNNLNEDVTIDDGVAASLDIVKEIKELADTASSNATQALSKATLAAPINHASPEKTYGLGDLDNYGHVKITDDFTLEATYSEAIVPSAKALSVAYNLAASNEGNIKELQEFIDKIKTDGSLFYVKSMEGTNLDTITENGTYVSKSGTPELSYPYLAVSKTSVLQVTSYEFDALHINQILFSDTAIYIRNSYDGGSSWDAFFKVSSEKEKDYKNLEIYLSPEYGDDANEGNDSFYPVKTWSRVYSLMNEHYETTNAGNTTQYVTIYLDRGTYTDIDIPNFSNLPLKVELNSFYYETIDEAGDDDYPGDLIENKPYVRNLIIANSNVSISNMKIDMLTATNNARVTLRLDEYISLAHVVAERNSVVQLGFYGTSSNLPLRVHHIYGEDFYRPLFSIRNNSYLYDFSSTELYFTENCPFTYIFSLNSYGNAYVQNMTFTIPDDITVNTGQYFVSKGSNLYLPTDMIGDETQNEIRINGYINGYPYGGGDEKKYLRADMSWSKIYDIETLLINESYTLTESNIKNVLLVVGNYTITVPSIGLNASFTIKNIGSNVPKVQPSSGIMIDGSSEAISLNPNEYIEIVQYDETKYAIIRDNRKDVINLMNMNIEDTVLSGNGVKMPADE